MPGEITLLLSELRNGDRTAEARLAPLVYAELHRIAARYARRERRGHTLQPTALVHEAYMRLVGEDRNWENRQHFFAIASSLMRNILIDYARSRGAAKRGGGAAQVELKDADQVVGTPGRMEDLLALDEALSRLSQLDARQCQIVEMRFFGGLNEEEIGQALGISARTVQREWAFARAWLHTELSRRETPK
jgi:RNA polymerase sigma-70 factor, ECF subfamily